MTPKVLWSRATCGEKDANASCGSEHRIKMSKFSEKKKKNEEGSYRMEMCLNRNMTGKKGDLSFFF